MPVDPPSVALRPAGAGAWPLVGRDAELAHIAHVRGAAGRGVVLAAAAGVGKSHLARHAVAAAERDGALVEWVQATRSAAAVPLGAFAGLLPVGARADDPVDLMRRSVAGLRERARGRPVVLGVDDAQLLDPISAALVLHLVVTGTAFVVATLRTAEPYPDAVESLWKDAGAERRDLRNLAEAETVALVEAVLGGRLEQRAAHWLFDRSAGNILYVRELVVGALADGALARRDGFWQLQGTPHPATSLVKLVGDRMAGLTVEERRVVELLALGEPLHLAELLSLADVDAVSGAETHGVITVDAPGTGGGARLAHPLYGETVRATMPVARAVQARRALARIVADRVEQTPGDALRIARWLLAAGDAVPEPLLADAAGAALLVGDFTLAARLAANARAAGADPDVALVLARAHAARRRFAEAETVLAEVEGAFRDSNRAFDYLHLRMRVLLWGLRQPEGALALLDRAPDWWPEPASLHTAAALRAHIADLISAVPDGPTATQRLAESDLDPVTRRHTAPLLVAGLLNGGRAREAHALALRNLPEIPLRADVDDLACTMYVAMVDAGEDNARLAAWARATLTTALQMSDAAAAGMAAWALGQIDLFAGRWLDAGRWLAEAANHFAHRDPFDSITLVRALQVVVAAHTGDPANAHEALARSRATLTGEPVLFEVPRHARAEAAVALADGDAPRAQRLLLDAAAQVDNAPLYAAQLLHEALRAGAAPRPLVAPMTALRARCDARLVAAYHSHVTARAAADGPALLRCADEFAAAGALRFASEAAAAAAAAFADAGKPDSARRAAARSAALHVPDQGGAAPVIHGIDGDAVRLTPREAQLVALAARGRTNAQIAAELTLSVRTVESHVYRAMQKLGVTDRRDLR